MDNETERENERAALDDWRRDRKMREHAMLECWLGRGQAALAILVPLIGFLWAAWFWGAEAQERRLQAARLAGWALLGCVVWVVVWHLWPEAFGNVLLGPVLWAMLRFAD